MRHFHNIQGQELQNISINVTSYLILANVLCSNSNCQILDKIQIFISSLIFAHFTKICHNILLSAILIHLEHYTDDEVLNLHLNVLKPFKITFLSDFIMKKMHLIILSKHSLS